MDPEDRSFTVEASSVGVTGGRYINRAPRRSALKAARILFDSSEAKAGKLDQLRVQMRETTMGSPDRLFAYEATKKKVNKTVNIAGNEVNIRQEINLSKVPLFHGDGVRKKPLRFKANKTKTKTKGGGSMLSTDTKEDGDTIEAFYERGTDKKEYRYMLIDAHKEEIDRNIDTNKKGEKSGPVIQSEISFLPGGSGNDLHYSAIGSGLNAVAPHLSSTIYRPTSRDLLFPDTPKYIAITYRIDHSMGPDFGHVKIMGMKRADTKEVDAIQAAEKEGAVTEQNTTAKKEREIVLTFYYDVTDDDGTIVYTLPHDKWDDFPSYITIPYYIQVDPTKTDGNEHHTYTTEPEMETGDMQLPAEFSVPNGRKDNSGKPSKGTKAIEIAYVVKPRSSLEVKKIRLDP